MFISGIFFWYGSGKQMRDQIAKVGKTKISLEDYRKEVARITRNQRESTEGELNENQVTAIRRQALSTLVTQELLYNESKRLNVSVTNDEVVSTIHNLPQFQQDGQFSYKLYRQTLHYSMYTTPEKFEEMVRKNIASRKLERLVLYSARITDPELQIHYLNRFGNLKQFDENKEEMRNELMQDKRMALYQSWMASLQQDNKITVNNELLEIK